MRLAEAPEPKQAKRRGNREAEAEVMGRGLSAESRQLIARAYEVLEREHPSGIRRVSYALFGNRAGEMTNKMSGLLSRARKEWTHPMGMDCR